MAENLALWEQVERTDPSQTKQITGKPYKGTSPKPYFLVHEATKAFGPCGIGWGFKILSERVEDGAAGDRVHIAHIQVWYTWEGKRGEVEHIGQTMLAGKNKNGPFTDEDAPKKSVTDGLVKALSMIGFAGDIFMGRYDDSKYLAEVKHEFSEDSTPPAKVNGAPATPPKGSEPVVSSGNTNGSTPAAPLSGDERQRKYASEFILWLGKANDVEQVRSAWREEIPSMKDLGILGTSLERELKAAWVARGSALARDAGNPNAPAN